MQDDRLSTPSSPEAARLSVGWEIVRASAIHKENPTYVAEVLAQVIVILRQAEKPPPEVEGDVTVHPISPRESSVFRGDTLQLTYSFSGGPTSVPLVLFVHFYSEGGDGSPIFQDDHDPPTPTTAWTGSATYTRNITVPKDVPPGNYRVGLGLYDRDRRGTNDRLELRAASGIQSDGAKRYEVGTVKVS